MKFKKIKIGLLLKVVIAIILGIVCSLFFPTILVRGVVTFNALFTTFLNFIVPLLILGLIAPGIAELGKSGGKLLGITLLIAYVSTIASGFFSYFTCDLVYPLIIETNSGLSALSESAIDVYTPLFTINVPPIISVMGALVTAFVLGLGVSRIKGDALKNGLTEFRDIIFKIINSVIIPLLPIYIFGVFLKMGVDGQIATILGLFVKVIIVVFVMHIVLLLVQYIIAGVIAKRNPFVLLKNMLPAYVTALGTQSSAATIPVTVQQTLKNGVDKDITGFVIPLCATIHLAGSILKIVACSMALMMLTGMEIDFNVFVGLIFTLSIVMIAAPGVPGGAIMAAIAPLTLILGFDEATIGMMIAVYIAMDSFGTACNVTGDGAIAVIVDKISKKEKLIKK